MGILSTKQEWFLQSTSLILYVYFALILINLKSTNQYVIYAFLIPFILGFISEFLGVNRGFIFGNYSYGENLGFKIMGVPLSICFNWVVLTVITHDFAKRFLKSKIAISITGALLMVLLDFFIEVSAPRFDFWEFENGIVPIQNYVGWFFVGFLAQIGYSYFEIDTDKKISLHLLFAITIFFSIFLFF